MDSKLVANSFSISVTLPTLLKPFLHFLSYLRNRLQIVEIRLDVTLQNVYFEISFTSSTYVPV